MSLRHSSLQACHLERGAFPSQICNHTVNHDPRMAPLELRFGQVGHLITWQVHRGWLTTTTVADGLQRIVAWVCAWGGAEALSPLTDVYTLPLASTEGCCTLPHALNRHYNRAAEVFAFQSLFSPSSPPEIKGRHGPIPLVSLCPRVTTLG